jgi:hypothetical protein
MHIFGNMRIITFALVAALSMSCGSGNKAKEDQFMAELDTIKTTEPSISKEVINGILQSIPSPLEISSLLKESGKKYNPGYLNSIDNLAKYNTNYKKALNLGVYGTDLGYTNIYEQNNDGIKYMSAIKSLADDLNIGRFFDVEMIGRLASNSKNLDSLLLITTQNFNDINFYLQNENRENLSVLLLTGGWLEAVNIVCEVSKEHPDNRQLQETVGEQKIILGNIVQLLKFYKDVDQNMALLLTDMEELMKAFDKVNITYTYKEPTYEIVDGVMMIKDNSTSTISISTDDVKNISSVVQKIRTKVIS